MAPVASHAGRYTRDGDGFLDPNRAAGITKSYSRLIRDTIVPLEGDMRQTRHGPSNPFRRELNTLAETAGLLRPTSPWTSAAWD